MHGKELERLRTEFRNLPVRDSGRKDRLLNELETILRMALPDDADRYVLQARAISFYPIAYVVPGPDNVPKTWAQGQRAMIELIESVEYHLKMLALQQPAAIPARPQTDAQFDPATIERIARIVCGGEGSSDRNYPKYRGSWNLTLFFRGAGLPQYEHDGGTRKTWVVNVLQELQRADLYRVITRLASRKEYDSPEARERAVQLINDALAGEDLEISGTPGNPIVQPIAATRGVAPAREQMNGKRIFVVHGRNLIVRDAMFDFLRSLGLEPIEWDRAVMSTGSASPFVGTVVEKAIRSAAAVVVLLTPEDEARLLPQFHEEHEPAHETSLTPQARPNVLFEAGMAFGVLPEKTFLLQFGETRPLSDVTGRNTIRFSGNSDSRNSLANRLEGVGIPVIRGGDWLRAGDFKPK